MIGAQRNENTLAHFKCVFETGAYLQLARLDRMNDADLSSLLLVLCAANADPWASWLAGCWMSEWMRRAARWTRPPSLCTAVVRYVHAMYEQRVCFSSVSWNCSVFSISRSTPIVLYGFSLTQCAGSEGAWGPRNGGPVAFLQLKQSLMTCLTTVVSCGIHNDFLIFAFVCSAPACSSFVCALLF
jgi:hypothetical protein